jgi:hypothetical protein
VLDRPPPPAARADRRPPPGRSPSADARARRTRARRRAGLAVFRFIRNRRRIVAALRASDRLRDAATHAEIEAALAGVIDDYCDRWLGKIPTA